jgi:conjugal transfer pilus assembly protein TraU
MFPIKIASTNLTNGEDYPSRSGSAPVCLCGNQAKAGIPTSFWEIVYMTDVTSVPGCFPLLGGIKIDTGINSEQYGVDGDDSNGNNSFQQINLYVNPVMYLIGAVVDSTCLDARGFDVPWISFADPLHNDDNLSMLVTPYAYPFAGLTALAAGSVDAVMATLGFPSEELFWVAGAWGPMYPITGNVSARVSREQMARLQTARIFAELHALGTSYSAAGEGAMCGYLPELIMDKRQYKFSRILPFPESKILGKCCSPIGRSTILVESGTQAPLTSMRDFSYAIFRKRDCCSGVVTPNSAN